jgi:2-phospho-L-lactate/phosphoenolpyruvate guanylyltransferase
VIPVKPLAGALGRLGGVLRPAERAALQLAMLGDVLRACREAPLAGTLVVTADPRAAERARAEGAGVVADHRPPRGMNAAVARGLRAAAARGAERALVLMADLPLARGEDLAAMLGAAPAGAGALLVPSREGTGTNALLLAPPDALAPALGPGSLARHRAQAEARGLPAPLLARPGLALDVDTPEDLEAFWSGPGPEGAARAACRALAVGERLAAACPR